MLLLSSNVNVMFIMKFALAVFTCVILVDHVVWSVPQDKIRLNKKGFYPGLPSVPRTRQRPTQRHTEVVIPSYFKTTKPDSLEGWLPKPKKVPRPTTTTPDPALENLVKDGYCGHSLNYGIRCGIRMDQCKRDKDCPGVAKCCLVSDCGFLCVKPKATRKHQILQKKKQQKAKESILKESVTTSQGLKLEDITKMPEKDFF